MLDLDHRARPEAHQLLWRLLELDPHGETLRYPYPIQRTFDEGHRPWKVDPVLVVDAPADSLVAALDRLPTIDHRERRCAFSARNHLQIGLSTCLPVAQFVRIHL